MDGLTFRCSAAGGIHSLPMAGASSSIAPAKDASTCFPVRRSDRRASQHQSRQHRRTGHAAGAISRLVRLSLPVLCRPQDHPVPPWAHASNAGREGGFHQCAGYELPPNVYRPGGPIALITNRCLFAFDRASAQFPAGQHPSRTQRGGSPGAYGFCVRSPAAGQAAFAGTLTDKATKRAASDVDRERFQPPTPSYGVRTQDLLRTTRSLRDFDACGPVTQSLNRGLSDVMPPRCLRRGPSIPQTNPSGSAPAPGMTRVSRRLAREGEH